MKNKKPDQLDNNAIDDLARSKAAALLHLVFLRVGRDSTAGCALRRALGFSSAKDLKRAAEAFCVPPSYLDRIQRSLEGQLGDLSFLAKHERGASGRQAKPVICLEVSEKLFTQAGAFATLFGQSLEEYTVKGLVAMVEADGDELGIDDRVPEAQETGGAS